MHEPRQENRPREQLERQKDNLLRRIALVAAAATAVAAVAGSAGAYPDKPITLIVP